MNRVTRNEPRDAWIAEVLRARTEDTGPRADCPDPARIWDAVRLQVPVDARLEIIDHLSVCPTCAEAWSLAAELVPETAHTAQQHVESGRSSAVHARRARLVAVAAVILVAAGIAFTVFRPAVRPDTASIKSPPTAPPTSAPSTSAQPASAQAASPPPQQTPNPVQVSPPVLLPAPAPRAALPDGAAVRNLIATYENYLGTRDLARLRAFHPNITSVELDALQKEPRAPGSNVSLDLKDVRITGRTGTATVTVRDTVLIRGERQERTSIHQLTFEKTAAGDWVVVSATPDTPPASPVNEPDEIAIRRVIEIFKTAIETRDVVLYRSVRPSLSAAEEERLRESFRRIDSQDVTITLEDISLNGRSALARILRRDFIVAPGDRRQVSSSRQTIRLEKPASDWIITAIEPF